MQKRSVYCRDVPCLAHMEQGPGPSTLSTHPSPYLSGYWGLSLLVALKKDGPGQWSGHLQAAQPRTCGPGKCMLILFFFPSSNSVSRNAYQMIICLVLIIVIFLDLINHNME
jgi:hypothetical protein